MTAFLFRAGAGVAGDFGNQADKVVENGYLNPANAPAAFGVPVKIVSGKFEAIESGDAATVFYGVLTRLAPSIAGDTAQTFNTGTPNTETVQGIMVEGYITVVAAQGTPVRGDNVFMRVTADVGKEIGDFETASIPGETVELTSVVWAVDGKDSDNISAIRIK